MVWISLASQRGAFGQVDRVLTERQLRSHDAGRSAVGRTDIPSEQPFGVRVHGGRDETPSLHYPDVLLVSAREERVALELELGSKGKRRLETSLAAYEADRSVAAVLYLSDDPAVLELVRRAAGRLGIADFVHVRRVARATCGHPAPA